MFKDFYNMPHIIFRYLAKEVTYTMLSVTMIVVFVFLCNQFVHYLTYVSSGKYAISSLYHLVLLQAPILIGYMLPLGLFLGVLLSFGRLYADSEMTVLYACGFSRQQLIRVTFIYALIVMAVVAFLVLWFNPIIALKRDQMLDQAEASTVYQTILPGRFRSTKNGKNVFYIESMSHDRHHMKNIFVAQAGEKNKWNVLSANKGFQWTDPETGGEYLVTQDGYRFTGVPGQKDYEKIKFDRYGVQLNAPRVAQKNEGVETTSTAHLIMHGGKNREEMAELQWRFAMPISVLLLALLAVPLSYVRPRQGRFAQLVPALFIYFIYVNLIFMSRSWIEDGVIPGWFGIWWVHLVVLGFAFFLLRRFTAVGRYKKRAAV